MKTKFSINVLILPLSIVEPESLRDYFKNRASALVIYHKIENLINIYPDIEEWYKKKVLKALNEKDSTREVLVAIDENELKIAGIAILKKTKEENKICTIRVEKEYLHQGIGTQLFEEAFKYLEDTKPLITISEDNIEAFRPILKKFDFKLVEKIKGLYVSGKIEYIYNKKFKKED